MTTQYSKRDWTIRLCVNMLVSIFYIAIFLSILCVFISFTIAHFKYYIFDIRPLPDYLTRVGGISYSVENMHNVILSTSFVSFFFIIPFFTLFSPITVIGLLWTIIFVNSCYKNYAKKYDDTKHKNLLKWLNIFYMPFYFFRIKKKGWLYIENTTAKNT